jgi:hypothetical protein
MIHGSDEALAAVDLDYGLLEKILCWKGDGYQQAYANLEGASLTIDSNIDLTPEETARVRQIMARAQA